MVDLLLVSNLLSLERCIGGLPLPVPFSFPFPGQLDIPRFPRGNIRAETRLAPINVLAHPRAGAFGIPVPVFRA